MTQSEKLLWGIGAIALVLAGLHYLGPVLPPFLIAFLIAYLGDPLVKRLMRWRMPRFVAAMIVFLIFIAVIGLAVGLLIPLLQRQIMLLIDRIPQFLTWLQTTVVPWLNTHAGFNENLNVDSVKKAISQHWQQTGGMLVEVWKTVSHSGVVIIEKIIFIILIPVVTFYLLRDWDEVWLNLQAYIPKKIRPQVISFMRECNEVLGAFFRGQLTVMTALAVIYSIGLTIAGLQLSLLIGILGGILNIFPYIGIMASILIASITMLMQYHDWIHVVYVLIVFGFGHVIDSTILTPNLIGSRIGLHPIAVIFAILVGGHLFGVVGVLLALPAASIIMVLQRHVRDYLAYRKAY